jgi:hypothetical protein
MIEANDAADRSSRGPCTTAWIAAGASIYANGCAEPDLDEGRTLELLTAAVRALKAAPGHPASDRLVQELQILARACRRRARAAQALVPHAQVSRFAGPLLARAERLADKAEDVAVWARTLVLGGDPGVLDHWLAMQRRARSVPPGG